MCLRQNECHPFQYENIAGALVSTSHAVIEEGGGGILGLRILPYNRLLHPLI